MFDYFIYRNSNQYSIPKLYNGSNTILITDFKMDLIQIFDISSIIIYIVIFGGGAITII